MYLLKVRCSWCTFYLHCFFCLYQYCSLCLHCISLGVGYLLFVAHTRITHQEIKCRFYGPCAVTNVMLNGVLQPSLTQVGMKAVSAPFSTNLFSFCFGDNYLFCILSAGFLLFELQSVIQNLGYTYRKDPFWSILTHRKCISFNTERSVFYSNLQIQVSTLTKNGYYFVSRCITEPSVNRLAEQNFVTFLGNRSCKVLNEVIPENTDGMSSFFFDLLLRKEMQWASLDAPSINLRREQNFPSGVQRCW